MLYTGKEGKGRNLPEILDNFQYLMAFSLNRGQNLELANINLL